jgi:very-short-patch-repair endonuclease
MTHPAVTIRAMAASANPDRAIARIARAQRGLITAQQARDAGLSMDSVRHRVASGALVRAGRRVYAAGFVQLSWEQRALAACLDLGAGALLSHRSAATVWKLDLPAHPLVEVTVSYGRGARGPIGVVVHRTRSLRREERALVGGLPATSLARTLLDLAGVIDGRRLAKVIDDALSRRLVAPHRLRMALDQDRRRCSKHVERLRELVQPWLDAPELESVAEAAFRRALLDAGLPAPAVQYPLRLRGVGAVRLDFAWPESMVAVEIDGFRWHADPESHAHDSARSNALAAGGWTVLRATPTELRDFPAEIITALRLRLRQP